MRRVFFVMVLLGVMINAGVYTLADARKEVREVRENIHSYRVKEQKISNASVEATIKFFKDDSGNIRKVVARINYEGGERELCRYLYAKDGSLVFSFVKSWFEYAPKKRCKLVIKSFYGDGKLLIRKRREPRHCKKVSKEDLKSMPVMPLKLDKPKRIVNIVKNL